MALISVSDKSGLAEFANGLSEIGFDFMSTGGTSKALQGAGVDPWDVSDVTGVPEGMDGRVKTLTPQVHGGLLARPGVERDLAYLEEVHGIWIDLVCVNLYPLQQEIAKPDSTPESVIEQTDIGGPTMLSSAAKGRRIVVCDPADYPRVLEWLRAGEPDREAFITELTAKAYVLVAAYRLLSGRYHGKGKYEGMIGTLVRACKYGENPHQAPAGHYSVNVDDPLGLDRFEVIGDGEPSYNNLGDVDRMLQTMTHIAAGFAQSYGGRIPYIAIAVKHGNPCGVGVDEDALVALRRMVTGDRRAIFGGLVMTNFEIGGAEADVLDGYELEGGQKRRILDGVVASHFTKEAIDLLSRKGNKCRFVVNPYLQTPMIANLDTMPRFRYVRGGFLLQPNYTYVLDLKQAGLENVPHLCAENLILAWAIGSTSNSNTVPLVRDLMLIGNGTGQQDRVGACKLAITRARDAGHRTEGAYAYSDSFFPFDDGPRLLINAGITTILASSGSIRDAEVKATCEAAGVPLYLVPDAEARGFFGH
ncbi:MAG: bifunctional phosphoribosylaminoimidazolecarboxamide formyltransferase/IMP cyclohydrolase [Candidatus Shapirobacteria bacterium]